MDDYLSADMNAQPVPEDPSLNPSAQAAARPGVTGVNLAADGGTQIEPKSSGPEETNSLTPEEQMERFAQELKENDWGHQPC